VVVWLVATVVACRTLLFKWPTCHELRFCPRVATSVVLRFLASVCLCLVVAKFNQMCGLFTYPNSSTTSETGLTLFCASMMEPLCSCFQVSFWGYKGSNFRWICPAAGENPQVKKYLILCPYISQCLCNATWHTSFLGVIHGRLCCYNMEYWTRLWGESLRNYKFIIPNLTILFKFLWRFGPSICDSWLLC
jgi:hypothetical protein